MDNQKLPSSVPGSAETATFIKMMSYSKVAQRRRQNLDPIDPETLQYLSSDWKLVANQIELARDKGEYGLVKSLQHRLTYFSIVESFFLYVANQGKSTKLANIMTEEIENFLQRQRAPSLQYGRLSKDARKRVKTHSRAIQRDRTELRAFFARAIQAGIIAKDPFPVPAKPLTKLQPKQPSIKTQQDCRDFLNYLNRRVSNNLLSPGTADRHYRQLLILLHDAEQLHVQNPAWPLELDGIFADPRWVFEWINGLQNRSLCTKSTELARDSVKIYLKTIRHLWIFLKTFKRAAETYYTELLALFRTEGPMLVLPGRSARVIEALSEEEEFRVFDCISRYSSNPISELRDMAMFITAIETCIRVDGLNSMCIENIEEMVPDVWECKVRVKRSAQKNARSFEKLTNGNSELRYWYMSPRALEAIKKYLQMTGRDSTSRGPIWLNHRGTALSLSRQQAIIREWLELAGCKFTRPHVLRHTGVDRLLNKYNLPISIVQEISQHADPAILLGVYSKRAKVDAFKEVNKIFSVDKGDIGCEDLILSIGNRLTCISAGISQRAHEKRSFNQKQAEELLGLLRQQIERLTKFLGYETTADVIVLSLDDYKRIGEVLQLAGLSFEKILGHNPQPQKQTVLRPGGRRPKSLLS